MKIVLCYLESGKEEWARSAQELYSEKISRFCQFEFIKIKSPSYSRENQNQKILEESKLIFSKIKKDDYLVLLDEDGKKMDSLQFSNFLAQNETLPKRIVFLIGGAFGVSEEIKERADQKISLSAMVMNHLVAQTVLLEQIYRAFTILKKIPYHNR